MKSGFVLLTLLSLAFTINARATPPDVLATRIDLTGIPAPYSFNRFCRLSSPEMWAVGGSGDIDYQSVNGSREFRPTEQDLSGVFFSSSNVGWVVGAEGTILRTKDAGEHWVAQKSGVENDLNAINCVDVNNCWIVGENGTTLRTNNGGDNWEILSSESSADLNALHFINAQIGWIVGEDGLVLHTQDGGSTWTEQCLKMPLFPDSGFETLTDLRAVIFIDENRGWVAGTNWLGRTIDGGKTWMKKNIEGTFIGLVSQDGIKVWAINDAAIALNEKNYFSKDSGTTWKKWFPKKDK